LESMDSFGVLVACFCRGFGAHASVSLVTSFSHQYQMHIKTTAKWIEN
jgi:hypothetical protein